MSVRILLTDLDVGDPALEIGLLEERLGAEVTVRNCRTEADVLTAVRETSPHGVLVQWAPITAAVLDAAPELRVVSRIGIGLDMVDVDAAKARGVAVRNVPHYCTEEVATHAVALGLSLWRRIPDLDREVRSGSWDAASSANEIRRLSSSTIGLIGMGRIGRRVADAYAVWGARVIVHDPVQGDDPYPRVSLQAIAMESHLVSLHAPLVDSTRHVVDRIFLTTCRQRPHLVNVSRGGLVDTVALADALMQGSIAGDRKSVV